MRPIDKIAKTQINKYSGIKPKRILKVPSSPEEQLRILVNKGREVLVNTVAELVPEKGKLTKNVSVSFDIPATNNHTIIKVEESAENKQFLRDLVVGVKHRQRDRLTSNLVLNRKHKHEIIDYLKSAKSQEELEQFIKQLSEKTDKFYNSL